MIQEKLIQKFECLVVRANDQIVECELHDLTDFKPVEYAEIHRSFFKNFDSSLLTEGRVFYWNIFMREDSARCILYCEQISEFELRS